MPRELRAAAGQPIRAAGGRAAITAAPAGGGLRRFSGVAYTGAPMRPQGWGIPIIVDLAGVTYPADQNRPALRQHDHEQIVGHTDGIAVSADKGIEVGGPFSGQAEHTAKVTEPADNGFKWQMSIGATPVRLEYLEAGKTATVNGREVTGPMDISRETELSEVSFVPLGADGDTSAVVANKGGRAVYEKTMLKAARTAGNLKASKYSDEDIDKMSDDEAKAALKECMKNADDEPDDDEEKKKAAAKAKAEQEEKDKAEAARKAGLAAAAEFNKALLAERKRVNEITARLAKYPGVGSVKLDDGRTVDLVAHAVEGNLSANDAELIALRQSRASAAAGGPTVYVTNKPELNDAVLEAAVLHAGRHQFRLDDDEFYRQPTPDGKGTLRRVPAYLEQEVRTQFRARYTDQVQQAAHSIFRGQIAPQQIIKAAFRSWGHEREVDLTGEHGIRSMLKAWDHYEGQREIRADGASTISISNILSNVQNKFALMGYLFTEQAWREFCAVRNVKDFKATKSINLLGDVVYKEVGASGEIEHAQIGDQAFSNQAKNFARILTMPWTHIVNDDLGMLTGVGLKIGQGAGLGLNDNIWTLIAALLAGTVNGDDGNAFFRTTSDVTAASKKAGKAYRPNKMTGGTSAFGDAALKTAKALFDSQIDPNGNPLGFDGLTPVLLHGPTLWRDVTAQLQAPTIVYGGGTAALAPSANPWQGQLKPVMSRYMESAAYVNSATAFCLFYNPVALAVVEVCFLNGVDTPAVLTAGPDYQFDRLGISIRGSMPFGSNPQNFRGGVFSAGA